MRPLTARALARIGLGALFVVRTTALANLLPVPLAHVRGPLLGWPAPGFALAWGGLVLPTSVQTAFCVVRTIAAGCFMLGVRARVSGLVAGACGFVALSQDPLAFVFTLYVLFAATMVMALTDATTRLGLVPDRPTAGGADDEESSTQLLVWFVASIYAYSAVAKLQAEWLSGRTLLALAEDGLVDGFFAPLILAHPSLRAAAAIGVFLVELALPPLLIMRRTRRTAILAALALHTWFELVTHPDVMGFVMATLLLSCSSRAAPATASAASD